MITSFEMMADQDLSDIRIAIAWPNDVHTIKAVMAAHEKVGITPILIGDVEEMRAIANEINVTLNNKWLISVKSPEEAAEVAVKMAKDDEVEAIMKGKVDTAVLLKSVVNRDHGIKKGGVISHFVVHEMPNYHKLLAMSDGGMNLTPDLATKKEIIATSVVALKKFGIETPNVAALAAVEKVNPKMIETVDAAALKEMNEKGELAGCYVEGPISYDLAMSKESASIKGYVSPVTGEVDLLFVPNITVGNVLGKALVYSANAKMAGVVLGAKVPIILTSRGSSYEEKYYSILLAGLVG